MLFTLIYTIYTGLEINSIHKSKDQLSTVSEAEAFFIGGGNTFLLLKTLYDLNLLESIKNRVLVSKYNKIDLANSMCDIMHRYIPGWSTLHGSKRRNEYGDN